MTTDLKFRAPVSILERQSTHELADAIRSAIGGRSRVLSVAQRPGKRGWLAVKAQMKLDDGNCLDDPADLIRDMLARIGVEWIVIRIGKGEGDVGSLISTIRA